MVVLPLMLGQLMCTILNVITDFNFISTTQLVLVVLVWILTFTIFVPIHNNIEKDTDIEGTTRRLVQKNWIRTIVWSIVFVISLARFIIT